MTRLRFALATVLPLLASPASAQIDARMFRYPDVSATQIAFVYAGDVWVVPKTGGPAARLTTPRGEEAFPRFSPDGSMIAFSGNYDGNTDIYTVPTAGGEATRITYAPGVDRMQDWTPDGKSLLYTSTRESGSPRFGQFYTVSAKGGISSRLPVPYGEFGTLSPDGNSLAYTPHSQDFRTWKRYRGGDQADVWLFDLKTLKGRNVTDNAANDAIPMWHGNTIYFISDRGTPKRNNLWAYEIGSGKLRQLTSFSDADITFPAIGPSDIVFQAGGKLYLFNLATEKVTEVKVEVVTDLATLRPRTENVGELIQWAGLSPSGQRAVFEARGDLFTVPAEFGPIRNLTATSGVADRWPSWSPDGKQVAYWSDASGEYELYVRPADGSESGRKLTSYGPGFRYTLHWSPDSKRLAFIDQTMTVYIFELDTQKTVKVDQQNYFFEGNLEAFAPSWSSDSRWLAYTKDLAQNHTAIAIFDTQTGRTQQVTSGYYNDAGPAFDPDGDYLYFFSNRTLRPVYSDLDNSFVYPNSTNLVAVPLKKDGASPLAPRSDEEKPKADSAKTNKTDKTAKPAKPADSTAADSARKGTSPKPVVIDLADFERRAVILPPKAGNFNALRAVSGKVLYRRLPLAGDADGPSPLLFWDLKERKEQTIVADVDGYAVSADGKKLLVNKKDKYAIVDVAAGQKMDKTLRTGEMESTVDPRAEWRQIFTDAWRFERDFFYEEDMHGVNWNQVRQFYGGLLEGAVTRWDVNWVLGEMIGELSSSHTYRGAGDLEAAPQRSVGMLGVDWSVENGGLRIARILDGAEWDSEVRSPLKRPGVNVSVGDYVLAVNGVPVNPAIDPYAAFQGLAEQTVELTVNDKPTMEGSRKVLVEPLASETRLRTLAWIEANRRRVDEASGGTIGYVYVPSTGIDGQTELVRQFNAQFDKQGLIVDERFNSGGQIPDRFIELLNRPALAFWAVRDGRDWQWPPVAHFGPKVMLINGWSGSGGDAFPYYFREAGLGPLIGQRTWGGLIGISGSPQLIDGGYVTVPTFRMYSPKGEWFAEGHGVEPDIAVVDDPGELARGRDPQLERAIEEVTARIKANPPAAPKRPPEEDRSR